jgi:hypothetical protein
MACPQRLFLKIKLVDISITVIRAVHVGDSMPSALLGELTGLCMTRGRVVWFVCSGWGPFAVVQ